MSLLSARMRQPLEQRVLALLELLLADLPELELHAELGELAAHARLVVQLALRFERDLFADPGDAPDRREGQRQQPGDQAHAGLPASTKWYGGSGPTYLLMRSGPRSRASASTCSSNFRSRSRSTRNATFTSIWSCAGSLTAVLSACGSSRPTTPSSSAARFSSTAAETISPSRIRSK